MARKGTPTAWAVIGFLCFSTSAAEFDVSIRDVSSAADAYGGMKVTGVVSNRLSTPLLRVRVRISIFDKSHNKIDQPGDHLDELGPGENWKFEVGSFKLGSYSVDGIWCKAGELEVEYVDEQEIITTNRFAAHPDFRIVNGQLYNIRKSNIWKRFKAEVTAVNRSSLVMIENHYQPRAYNALNEFERAGVYMAGPTVNYPPINYGPKDGISFVLKNYTQPENTAVGQTLYGLAMRAGVTNYDGEQLELWDCGAPNIVTIIRTNFVK